MLGCVVWGVWGRVPPPGGGARLLVWLGTRLGIAEHVGNIGIDVTMMY